MSDVIGGQVRFVLITLCLGMGLMAGYDILRFLRWIVRHQKWIVWLEDILYWLIMAVPAYVVFFMYNDGAVRWYGAAAVFLGGILYEQGISRVVRRFGRCHLEKPKQRLIRGVVQIVRFFSPKKWKRQILAKMHKKEKKGLHYSDK